MVFSPDGTRLMALEAQLSPITVEDIAARTGLYERDGVQVCWFGFRPRPWVGTVSTLLVQAPEDRGQEWRVTAGLARLALPTPVRPHQLPRPPRLHPAAGTRPTPATRPPHRGGDV